MTNIVVPELGESVVEARVVKWLKNAGDRVSAGDALVELETEKIDLEVSADRPGVLSTIKHNAGDDVKVGEVLAELQEEPTGSAGATGSAGSAGSGSAGSASVAAAAKAEAPKAATQTASDKKATPTARNVAKAHDVQLESVTASGTRVKKDDVLRATAPAPARLAPTPLSPLAPVGTLGTLGTPGTLGTLGTASE